MKEIRSPRINGDMPRPEIVVHPRLDIAAQLGVSVQSISETIRIATLGDLPQNGAKFALSDRTIPIRVSLPESRARPAHPGKSARTHEFRRERPLEVGRRPELRPRAVTRAALQAEPTPVSGRGPGARVQLGDATKKINALPPLKNFPPAYASSKPAIPNFMKELVSNFLIACRRRVDGVRGAGAAVCSRFSTHYHLSALPLSLGGALLAFFLTNTPSPCR